MQDVAIVEKGETLAHVLEDGDDLVEPEKVDHSLLPHLERPHPLRLAQPRRIGIILDSSFPSTDELGEGPAIRIGHEDV